MNGLVKNQHGVLTGLIKPRRMLTGLVRYGKGGSGSSDVSDYDGEYSVTPKAEEQTLPTKDKRLTEDLTINAIPYYETSNEEDGLTVFIG